MFSNLKVKTSQLHWRRFSVFIVNFEQIQHVLTHIYLFKVNKISTRKRCEICSKLTIKTPERRHWRRFGVFIINFEQISHHYLVFLLLNLNKYMFVGVDLDLVLVTLNMSLTVLAWFFWTEFLHLFFNIHSHFDKHSS